MNTKKLTYTALLIATGVLLPQVFHLFGSTVTGATFLPMHIPVLIAGLLLGPLSGAAVGIISPILSSLITMMPTTEKLPFMIIELFIYGITCGIFNKYLKNIYVSMISAMIIGRAVYACTLAAAFYIFNMKNAAPIAVWNAFLNGLPGIVIQLIAVPPIVFAVRRYIFERRNQES